ncbi:MAG TPA: MAE_28990/MAE_18760 family HEPN-like nuclease [Terracidiphilus sp.]|nr:MAE_28990/MAE_18760 family HEPN-like nuclease [Terracidiphilus sp.]
MFKEVSKSVTIRLREVRRLLAHIRLLEEAARDDGDKVSAENAATLRGLLFVQLYGTFEYAVEQSVQLLLQHLSKAGIPYPHFEHLLGAITLDPEFESAATVRHDRKWVNRRALLEKQRSSDICQINDTMFADMLQSIWFRTINDLFEWLCITSPPVPEARIRGYIDDVTKRRHDIAHGRLSPGEVGRSLTSTDVKKRVDAISDEINHIFSSFENFVGAKAFIAISHRSSHLPKPPSTRRREGSGDSRHRKKKIKRK